ncbi:MAG: arginine--tRNA ligase [Christensenellales bacterium]
MDLKDLLIKNLPENLQKYKDGIQECADSAKGDFCLPCFALAKELKKSPVAIATELADSFKNNKVIQQAEAVNGYLNLFLNKQVVAESLIDNYQKYGLSLLKDNVGYGKTICIDYSSANLAKYLHIGHLSTTILGECLARLFENAGYKVVRINFVGDYGTPFGKIVSAYKLWGKKEDIEARGVDAIQDLYVEFCKHEGEEYYDNMARECFAKIEQKDPETMALYNWILDISLKYNKQATKALGVEFDDHNGESYYNDKMDDIIDLLEQKGLLQDGENGAKIVKLGDEVEVIKKSDGSSLYATRDLAAVVDRYNKYHFYKNYYVTDVAQKLHFKHVFEILKLMGYDYADDCEHIYYGRIRLPEGKISSRLGKQALISDIVAEATKRATEIIKERNLPNADEVAKVVGLGATVYTVTKNEKIKDTVFDIEQALKFEGETSPYMQYTYARLSTVLKKAGELSNDFDTSYLTSEDSYNLVKLLYGFAKTIKLATEKLEPNIVSKYTMEMCKAVNKFYTTERILVDNIVEKSTKCKLIEIARQFIKSGLNLICIGTVESM